MEKRPKNLRKKTSGDQLRWKKTASDKRARIFGTDRSTKDGPERQPRMERESKQHITQSRGAREPGSRKEGWTKKINADMQDGEAQKFYSRKMNDILTKTGPPTTMMEVHELK